MASRWRTERRVDAPPLREGKVPARSSDDDDDESSEDEAPGAYAITCRRFNSIRRPPSGPPGSAQLPEQQECPDRFSDENTAQSTALDLNLPRPISRCGAPVSRVMRGLCDEGTVQSGITWFDEPEKAWYKGRRGWIIAVSVFLCGCAAITAAVIVVISKSAGKSEGTNNYDGTPYSKYACEREAISPDPFVQCQCQHEITQVSDSVKELYDSLKAIVFQGSTGKGIAMSSCLPQNIALLWTAREMENNNNMELESHINRFVLAVVYASMGGKGWKVQSEWLNHDISECQWHGVKCDISENDVISLDLSDNDVHGSLPTSLSLLQALQTLDLEHNSIIGVIPAELWGMPSLEDILLGDNKLEGTLPSTLSELAPTLKILSLFKNDIHGTIPEVSGLTRLIELNLNSTIIGGTFPAEDFDRLTNLEILDISMVPGISGSLPPSIGALTGLKAIHLKRTGISGTLPESIGNLTSLEHLNIEAHNLRGTIPTTVGHLTNLHLLQISGGLTGTIPTTLGHMTAINSLILSYNKLEGSIPTELAMCHQLVEFLIDSNPMLQGTLPREFADLSNLGAVDLSCTDINISGGLCRESTVIVAGTSQYNASACSCCESKAVICEETEDYQGNGPAR